MSDARPAEFVTLALAVVDRLVRPRPALAATILIGAALLVPAAGLAPGDVASALAVDWALDVAFAEGDVDAIAAAGRERLKLPVAERDTFTMGLIADALYRTGARGEALVVADRARVSAQRHHGERSLAAAMAANNLAWFLVSLDDPGPADLDEAFELAREANDIASGNPFFLGTLGTVELVRDDLAAAREHLRAAIAAHEPDAHSASDRAILAIVLAREGDAVGARASLDAARSAGTPDPAWFERAKRAVQSASSPPPSPPPPDVH